MKKFISILLTISLVFSLCAVSASAAEEKAEVLSYAVASDLHFNFPDEKLEWFSEDPIYGYANRRAAMENESGLIIDEFLNQCAEDDNIQFVLISGDLADNGKGDYTEHTAVAEKLKDFEEKTGKSVYVIPGNHDVCNPSEDDDTDLARFMEIYADFGYDKALVRDLPYASYTADLGEKYRLIALDSNDPSKSTEDGMNEHKVQWVIEQAEQSYKDGRYPILMMHHNLLDHLPMQRLLSHDFIIRNHTLTAERWANAGIKLVFSGHEHCSDATTYVSTTGNTISDFATTSLTMYPLQYRYIEMSEDEIKYEAKTVDEIDTDALLEMIPDYSPDQIDAMNNDLNEYAKNFLKNGVEWRLERGFLDEQLGISPDDIYYGLVRDAIDALNDVLNMPLYGKASAQELGTKYGIEIPDSDYKDGWDVATELVAAHYAGSEDYPLSGRDVTLLMRLVSIILKTELVMVDNTILAQAANAIINSTLGRDKYLIVENYLFGLGYGPISPGEYFLLAIASPLLQSFANDDNVDDNNGTIDGYGTDNRTENMKLNFTMSVNEFLSTVKMILKFILKGIHVVGQVE